MERQTTMVLVSFILFLLGLNCVRSSDDKISFRSLVAVARVIFVAVSGSTKRILFFNKKVRLYREPFHKVVRLII